VTGRNGTSLKVGAAVSMAGLLAPRPLGLVVIVRRWLRRRQGQRALAELPDHLLRDIGLTRGEIDHAVTHGRARGDAIRVAASDHDHGQRGGNLPQGEESPFTSRIEV
jgi:uncharacterized protein YjiS (DUF1127 family)